MGVKPLFYREGRRIFQRPTKIVANRRMMGFAVCDVVDDIDPEEVLRIMNNGGKPDEDEPE